MKLSVWWLSALVVLTVVSAVASFKKDKIARSFWHVVTDISWAIFCSIIAFMSSGFGRILLIFFIIAFLSLAFLDLRQYINLRAFQRRYLTK